MTTQIDLAEFVSDYLQIEGAEKDSSKEIAEAYLDATEAPESAEVSAALIADINYYRP